MEAEFVPDGGGTGAHGSPAEECSATTYDRAFRLISAFTALGPGPQRLHDVASRAELLPSTTHRILQAGIRAGVFRKAGRGRYLLEYSRVAPMGTPDPVATIRSYRLGSSIEGRAENILGALRRTTGQTVMLHVPILVGVPSRYCLAYLAPDPDSLMNDAERQVVSDVVLGAPLHADSQGEAMLAHLVPRAAADTRLRSIADARFTCGPSPVAGWVTVTSPVACGGRLVAAVTLAARRNWLARHRRPTVAQVMRAAAALGDGPPAARGVPLPARAGATPVPVRDGGAPVRPWPALAQDRG
ncbi:transcriptional regulator, IclR family [Actinobacteria bacterium OK074]|nr:transcriptional regulator, IclR family [Actinobacteria bacterium OK074]